MDDSGPTASIIFFMFLLLINIFFYGFEAAIDSVNSKEVEKRAEEKDKKSIKLKRILDNPTVYVNVVRLITTLTNIVIGAVHFSIFFRTVIEGLKYLSKNHLQINRIPAVVILIISAFVSAFVILYITLTIGVLLPKKIASEFPDKWAYACITPVYSIINILKPFTGLITATANGILRIFGMKPDRNELDVTEEEIISMVNEGHEQGLIQASEAEMISNIFEFGDKEAQDIMTHRNNILAIDGNTSLSDTIAFLLDGKNSRYPVFEENIDQIIGILHFKDAMKFFSDREKQNLPIKEIEGLMREPVFIPQTKNIDELFHEMQARKLQMVIVVDEYGQTDGLVAMEDILEEIVGNILDEYDVESQHIEEKSEDEFIMEGKTLLEELEERFSISFEGEEFETLNGFMISRLDRIPEPDEQFDFSYQGYNFKILQVENKMIKSVLVTKLPEESDEGCEENELSEE